MYLLLLHFFTLSYSRHLGTTLQVPLSQFTACGIAPIQLMANPPGLWWIVWQTETSEANCFSELPPAYVAFFVIENDRGGEFSISKNGPMLIASSKFINLGPKWTYSLLLFVAVS